MTTKLDGPRQGPRSGGPAKQLVVMLHGLGADGADLIGLAGPWGQVLPDAAFVSPDAPFPCDMSPFGRQWFSLQDRDPQRLIVAAQVLVPMLDAFLDAELATHGLGPESLALMGFSQGAMTSLHLGLRGAAAPATILAYSGALLGADSLAGEIRHRPPVLIVHGEDDPVVPVTAGRFAESALHEAGVPVQAMFLPGLQHGIDERGLVAGARMLLQAFGLSAA